MGGALIKVGIGAFFVFASAQMGGLARGLLDRARESVQASELLTLDGQLAAGVTAKDLVLALIARIGTGGATGHVLEYAGSAIRDLDMEGRMTVCNMSIEAGAKAGLIAPDEKTFAWLEGRPRAPKGEAWAAAVERWRQLPSDEGAVFDRELAIDASALEPRLTWG
ncbi:MAG TPA: 3-isopropylmalate dehydratase large subunit, partial [Planctomycetes bacterium]|nr:3-isopropylmalate dehydratase large subunit [Planctomycetota bacterium]